MPKAVLSIGQCVPDESTLENYLDKWFDVKVDTASLKFDAIISMKKNHYDLVLINRKLDADYSDGLEIIREMQLDINLKKIVVMLISNHPEAQDEAVALGAIYGFGKLEYSKPETKERLAAVLS